MRSVELKEHRTTPSVALSAAEIAALRARVRTLGVEPTPGRPGRYDLRPGAQVGSLELPGLRLRILPKLPIERVFFLLAYSADPKWTAEASSFGEHDDLVEAVAVGFVHQVRRALRQGLLQGYRTRDEALAGLRGRIRFEDQLRRRFGRRPPAEVRYDDFTVDIEENRLLYAAVRRLGRLRIRSPETRRSLRALREAFAEVMPVRYAPQLLPVVSYTRLNVRYRPAVELARRILRSTSFELVGDGVAARGFLVDMNQLFEDFVVTALREALGLSERTFPQNAARRTLTLDEAGKVRLEPDVSWWRGGRCRFVGDVKYKHDAAVRGKHPDLYQVLAYAAAADLPGGLLIYAAGEMESGVHHVRHVGKRLEVVSLDLAGSPPEVLEQVASVASRIRAMAVDGGAM